MRWLVLALCGCTSGGQYVVVSVDGLPEGTSRLVARSVLDGRPAQPEVWNQALSGTTSFALKLGDGALGRYAVGVEAWAGDCVTAWQSGEVVLAKRVDLSLSLALLEVPVCDGSFVGGPEMVLVPAGPFRMGCNRALDNDCLSHEDPPGVVDLNAFQIDRTEVTIAAYRSCSSCDEIHTLDEDYHPAELTWNQAKAYCDFRNKRLPTEAEWEKAARGNDGRVYPWGNDAPTCERARFDPCGLGSAEVGISPDGASPYGALDMAGNVEEWVSDWYADSYPPGPRTNPTGPVTGTDKILRGGNWANAADSLRTSSRDYMAPGDKLITGVRCAR